MTLFRHRQSIITKDLLVTLLRSKQFLFWFPAETNKRHICEPLTYAFAFSTSLVYWCVLCIHPGRESTSVFSFAAANNEDLRRSRTYRYFASPAQPRTQKRQSLNRSNTPSQVKSCLHCLFKQKNKDHKNNIPSSVPPSSLIDPAQIQPWRNKILPPNSVFSWPCPSLSWMS